MKNILVALLLVTAPLVQAQEPTVTWTEEFEETDGDEAVFSPEEEAQFYLEYLTPGMKASFRFPQTTWRECLDEITGNYFGYNCSNRRAISVILKRFIDNYVYRCIDAGLKAQGGGVVNELHIVHAGILGDPNHSPRSLHAENRAIDVKSFEMRLTNGQTRKLVYAGTTNRTFFTAFRNCWGQVVKQYNGCPFYRGNQMYTGSIGWEDKNHQQHMHMSVPYCVSGSYAGNYFQR